MFWHKVLHQYLSANTFNRIIRLRISVITVFCACAGGMGKVTAAVNRSGELRGDYWSGLGMTKLSAADNLPSYCLMPHRLVDL
jgi:hypothetical protein